MPFTHSTKDLVAKIAEKSGLNKASSEAAVKALISIITDAAVQREDVKLHGLGVFKTVERKARVGRNVRTGLPVEIGARVALVFRPAKHLKDI